MKKKTGTGSEFQYVTSAQKCKKKKNCLKFCRKTFAAAVFPRAVYWMLFVVVLNIYIRPLISTGLPKKTSAFQLRQHCRPKAEEGPTDGEEGGGNPNAICMAWSTQQQDGSQADVPAAAFLIYFGAQGHVRQGEEKRVSLNKLSRLSCG